MRQEAGLSLKAIVHQFGNKWGVGDKQKNNGIVFLVAVGDRETFIVMGTGLEESILPDDKVPRILDQEILPFFRKGNMAEGIRKGTLRLAQELFATDAPSKK